VSVLFKKGAGHRIEVFPALDIPAMATREQSTQAATAILASRLEDIIRIDPPQWHLFQPNWPSDERFMS
jgi:lauroyl/myristoyl acyltransferase